MSAWIDAWPVMVATLLTTLGPGLLIASLLGARGLDRFALAAPVSFGLAGVSAVVMGLAGIPFTPVTFMVALIVFGAIVVATRLALRRRGVVLGSLTIAPKTTPEGGLRLLNAVLTAAAVVVPAALIARRYARAMQGPDHIAQLFDNVYHLNAVALISQTHSGSSLTLGSLTEASRGFYPAAMHDLIALTVQLGGFSVPSASNASAILVAAVVWPLSILFLTVRIFGPRPGALLIAGVLSAGFSAFPYLLMSWGLVAPLHAAIAMLPVALGLLIQTFGTFAARGSRPAPPLVAAVPVFAGLGLSHPSAVVAALVFAAPFVIARTIEAVSARRSSPSTPTSRPVLIGAGLYLIVTVVASVVARPDLSVAPWFAFESQPTSIGSVLALSPMGFAPAWALAGLVTIGLVIAVRSARTWWPLVALFLGAGVIYTVGASFPEGLLRDLITSVWYRDNYRLAALLPTAALPLAILGATTIASALTAVVGRPSLRTRRPSLMTRANLPVLCAVVVAIVLIPLTQTLPLQQAEARIHDVYSESAVSRLVSPDEEALIDVVGDFVPEDGVIVGNPLTGASLVYALGDRRALATHIFGTRTPDEQTLLDRWDEAGDDPAVCDIIRESNAYWALDFPGVDALGRDSAFAGLDRVGEASGIRELASVGAAVLYETTACGPVPPREAGR